MLPSGRSEDEGDQQVQAGEGMRETRGAGTTTTSPDSEGVKGVVCTLEQAPGQRPMV